jgi:mRNA interferase MazF
MNVKRNDVVLVDFPFPRGAGSKLRPALVIQNNTDNARLANTIVAQITGNVQRAGQPTQILIEISSPAGKQSGLQFDSVVNCVNIVTLDKTLVQRRLGELPTSLMQLVDAALKAVLQLP